MRVSIIRAGFKLRKSHVQYEVTMTVRKADGEHFAATITLCV